MDHHSIHHQNQSHRYLMGLHPDYRHGLGHDLLRGHRRGLRHDLLRGHRHDLHRGHRRGLRHDVHRDHRHGDQNPNQTNPSPY